MQINFDMDGTIADLYGVEGWLEDLMNENTRPYAEARPLLNLSLLARYMNQLQRKGFEINIISWLSKCGSPAYDEEVTKVKIAWLKKHMPSVHFDSISIVAYGTPKQTIGKDFLFDDEERNRLAWDGIAYDVDDILGVLKEMLRGC